MMMIGKPMAAMVCSQSSPRVGVDLGNSLG
jgi:hypothetical protein